MKLEASKTAVLTLDLQMGILATSASDESIIPNASRIVEFARKKNYQVIHVGLGFSEGHPEISDRDTPFLKAKQNNLFVKGSPSAEFHQTIIQLGDLVIYKQRVSAFSENHLNLTLHTRGIENLVLSRTLTGEGTPRRTSSPPSLSGIQTLIVPRVASQLFAR
jgi:nicotinamidase-related amidase